ncbi:MAG: hypothetical protein H8D45_09950 [Bacteroidetes bacterium]|nr:hypothetical protein [Bacteroidota bacterium]MBL7105058.1 hypothetical protein [Bacteroidales bacterium]
MKKIGYLSRIFLSAFCVFSISPILCQNVTSITGSNNQVLIQFDTDINPTTVNSTSLQIQGNFRGFRNGSYETTDDQIVFIPAYPFLPNERVSISVKSSISTLGGDPHCALCLFILR